MFDFEGDKFFSGFVRPSKPDGEVIVSGEETNPNEDRHFLTTDTFVSEFENSTSFPRGHGIAHTTKVHGCYSFIKNNVKMIVFNNTAPDENSGTGKCYVDRERYDWLSSEL